MNIKVGTDILKFKKDDRNVWKVGVFATSENGESGRVVDVYVDDEIEAERIESELGNLLKMLGASSV